MISFVFLKFNKDQGKVEECKLKVVYVAPRQPPSPVAEESEEGFSPCNNTLENFSDVRISVADIFVYDSFISSVTDDTLSSVRL